jgi:predicted nucleic acid-binding protein
MTLIVDASVAIKWVIDEPGTESARQLISAEVLAAPEFLFVECANVLRTLIRQGRLEVAPARELLAAIDAVPIRAVPIRPHAAAAHAIAVELNQSAYDSLYLATAVAERSKLVTADTKFAAAVLAHPVYRDWLRPLAP